MDLPPSETSEENVTNCSTKGSSDGEGDDSCSSIEALNWSDLEDYVDEDVANVNSSELVADNDNVNLNEEGTEADDDVNTNLLISSSTTLVSSSADMDSQIKVIEKDNQTDKLDLPHPQEIRQRNSKRKRNDLDDLVGGTTPITSINDIGDLSSNAAVLDDGPIWAKGSKKYRFEENTKINQKLTIGVILSVVLAIGLGLGNLVAYNECEAEHKAEKSTCPLSTKSQQQQQHSTKIPSVPDIPIPLIPNPSFQVQRFLQSVIPTVDSRPQPPIPAPAPAQAPEIKPIDPHYSQQAEELSRVLKVLDELSRKIDQFENTTRELGGLFMMKDDVSNNESKKTKFVQALSDIMKQKSYSNPKNFETFDNINKIKTWKEQKEEVLDEIAGAVLEVMGKGNPVANAEDKPSETIKEEKLPKIEEQEQMIVNTGAAPTVINNNIAPTLKLQEEKSPHNYSKKSTKSKFKPVKNKKPSHKNNSSDDLNKENESSGSKSDKKKDQMKYSIPYPTHNKQAAKTKIIKPKAQPRAQSYNKETKANWEILRSNQREMYRRGKGNNKHSFKIPGEYDALVGRGRDWQSEREKVRNKYRQKNKNFNS